MTGAGPEAFENEWLEAQFFPSLAGLLLQDFMHPFIGLFMYSFVCELFTDFPMMRKTPTSHSMGLEWVPKHIRKRPFLEGVYKRR